MAPVSASPRRARPLLGTFVEISLADASGTDAEAAVEAAFAAVAKVHRLMSFHEQESDVARLNREACEHPVTVDPWTFAVLEAALDLNRRSAGAFDVTVAPVLEQLGLLPQAGQASAPSRASGGEVIELLAGRRVRFRDRGVRIDLGGIAKGFAVDRAIDVLRARGLRSALVNAGGDLAAFGPSSHTVHIRDPRHPRRLIGAVAVREEALATSGARFDPIRSGETAGVAIIDPAVGAPAHAVRGATVRAKTCMLADALTKVAMIAPASAPALLASLRASALIVLANGDLCVTDDWRDAISLAA
jgi:thiamine biosynthesis lipoprotein